MSVQICRETANFIAFTQKSGSFTVKAKARHVQPRSRVVSMATWQILEALSDAEFDGSCVLELGIGTWQK